MNDGLDNFKWQRWNTIRKNANGCKTAPWRREDVGYVDRFEKMSKWSAGKQRSATAWSTVQLDWHWQVHQDDQSRLPPSHIASLACVCVMAACPLHIGKNLENMMNIETLFAHWNWDFQQLEPSGEVSEKLSKCSVVQSRSKINRSGRGMTQYKSGWHVKFYIFTDVPHTHTGDTKRPLNTIW